MTPGQGIEAWTRRKALERLDAFAPAAGRAYAAHRNDASKGAVSRLSFALRHRLITEVEVLEAVLRAHPAEAAEKFIQEVCWRSYWKGWLQMRPTVWADYRAARDAPPDSDAMAARLRQAMAGQTGIDCFDAWARELTETGYLHNHVRMWVASIWIFTLQLPWAAGADWFMSQLLDGDPASNTLSWRWVAGLQTRGKHYVARAKNIARFTGGEHHPVGQLNEDPAPLSGPPNPEPVALDLPGEAGLDASDVLLVLDDELSVEQGWLDPRSAGSVLLASTAEARSLRPVSSRVVQAVGTALEDTRQRLEAAGARRVERVDLSDVPHRVQRLGARRVVTAKAPVGPATDALSALETALNRMGVPLLQCTRAWDQDAWPRATHGYFRFRKSIPALLDRHVRCRI